MYQTQKFQDNGVLFAAPLNAMDQGVLDANTGLAALNSNDTAADGAYQIVMVKRNGVSVPIWVPIEGSYYTYTGEGAVSPRNVYKRTTLYAQPDLQDGAIYDGKNFVANAHGTVYIKNVATGEAVQTMTLDKKDILDPHSNALSFSTRNDALHLYTNIYSNYKSDTDKHIGECCVYRLTESGGTWSNTLEQIIKVGFIDDSNYWPPSTEERPYGNFVVDDENNLLYVYVLYKTINKISWFKFDLPAVTEGVQNSTYGCPVYTLEASAILSTWTTAYQEYIQGACVHKGLIYSTSGAGGQWGDAVLSVVDPAKKTVVAKFDFHKDDNAVEPESIDFDGDVCYYGDIQTMFRLDFF